MSDCLTNAPPSTPHRSSSGMFRRSLARRKGYSYSPAGTIEDFTGSFRHSYVGARGVQDGSIPPGMTPDEFSKLRQYSGDREGFGGMPDSPRMPSHAKHRAHDPLMDVRWGEATEAEAAGAGAQPIGEDKSEWAFKGSDAFGGTARHRVQPTSQQLREAGLLSPNDDPLLGPQAIVRKVTLGPVYYALLSGVVVTIAFMAKFGN